MTKLLFLTYTFGGTAAAVGGYYGYSLWRTSNIQKLKEFKEILDEYEQKQDKKKVYEYLKGTVCKETGIPSNAKSWCDSIKGEETIRELVEGLRGVNGRKESYEKTLSRIVAEVPLEGQIIPK